MGPGAWIRYGLGVATAGACTAVAGAMFTRFELSDLILVHILGVVLVATRWGRGPSVAAALLSVAAAFGGGAPGEEAP